jgi:ubiquinone/menaquinone biosynthesis C-methylase UbiE
MSPMRLKRFYYNLFSHFYDGFVRLHSGDRRASMRDFLARSADLRQGYTVVDLCTGTGSSALRMVLDGVSVIGIDLSEGMLRQAQRKSGQVSGIYWIQADAKFLPIASSSVDRITCSYAMYEIAGDVRSEVLQEAIRILKPHGIFIMMEHLPPNQRFIRLLYLARIYLLGTKDVLAFAGSEETELSRFFLRVETVVGPGAKTKAVLGYKSSPRIRSANISAV